MTEEKCTNPDHIFVIVIIGDPIITQATLSTAPLLSQHHLQLSSCEVLGKLTPQQKVAEMEAQREPSYNGDGIEASGGPGPGVASPTRHAGCLLAGGF